MILLYKRQREPAVVLAAMASISPNIISATESTAVRPGETLISANSRPAALPVVQKQQKPLPENLEESLESLTLERKRKKGDVRLRLARFGRKNAPFYRIHAAHSRSSRDGKFLERIGYYDPRPGKDGQKRIALNLERAKYWLSVGAQPTDVVRYIFSIAGLFPKPPAKEE